MLIITTATVLVGAALLFFVQPMFARMVLPMLGGSPAVWNTAMVFYQAALLGGYAYAHWVTARFGVRRQSLIHVGLVLLAIVSLPIAIPHGWTPPTQENPIPWMLALFAVAIGLPFFVVSATGPLMQKWLSESGHPAAPDPYFLYAASNVGSLVGLLSYPVLVEPYLGLAAQTRLWTVGYGVFAALIATGALMMRRSHPSHAAAARAVSNERIAPARRLRWIALAFVPSSLMMGATTYITTDIAAVPLLWVIPLTLYLVSFIIVFAKRPSIPHALAVRVLPLVVLPLLVVLLARAAQPILMVMGLHLLALFVAALVCHGELSRDRPAPGHLTEFYLWLAVGGVLGGAFNALLAPLVFKSVAEYPIAIVLVCLLAPSRRPDSSTTARARVLDWALPAALGLVLFAAVWLIESHGTAVSHGATVLMIALAIIPLFAFTRRPLRFALGASALLLANPASLSEHKRLLTTERSFFGVHRVLLDPTRTFHQLKHGSTIHGIQRVNPMMCREPYGYYARFGPVGDVFAMLDSTPAPRSIALAGLGAGGLAAYARAGDRWTYYEIDPIVKQIATDTRYFCFLHECPADVRIVLGDARLTMAADSAARYTAIVLDAYTSDVVPVHLLTREALAMYLSRLTPNGVIVFHISNRYFDLVPVVAKLADDAGLACVMRYSGDLTDAQIMSGYAASQWIALARRPEDLGSLAHDPRWTTPHARRDLRAWTDDYSSLFSVFR